MAKFIKEKWYREFFGKYYLQFFAQRKTSLGTKKEVKFICEVLNLPKGAKILDLASGPGRHAVELAKKGFKVTCLDFNRHFLHLAKKLAKKNKVFLQTIQSDMRDIPFRNEFDAVINMFSSFGYFEKERENLKVLKAVSRALKPNGLFLLDLANKNWVLKNVEKKTWDKIDKTYVLEKRFFDRRKNIFFNEVILISPNKKEKHTFTLLRLYGSFEINEKLKNVGFKILKFYGGYNKEKFVLNSSPRLIILAKKHF